MDEQDLDLLPNLAHLKQLSEVLVDPEFYIRLTDEIGVPIIAVRRGTIVIFNRAAELLFGYHRMEVVGRRIEMLVPDGKKDIHVSHVERFDDAPRARPMGIDLPLVGRNKDGREFPIEEINLVPISTTSGVITAAVVWRKRV